MSEREPITAELRRVMNHTTMAGAPLVEIGEFEFTHRCDAIDAVHAGLERENAELRERLAALDNRNESMHIGEATVTITDELRKWAEGDALRAGMSLRTARDQALAIADRIDAEQQRFIDEHYQLLPVDADGVPIHVGDVMDGTCPSGKHVNGTVSAIGDGVFWLSNVQFSLKPDYMHHYHAPTVEDVLREMHAELDEVTALYVGEAIDSDERDRDEARIFAEYAKRLTLAGDAE